MDMDKNFKKSSFSQYGDGNNMHCVEVKRADGGIFVRDSKNPDGGMLEFTRDEWKAFLKGASAGEFNVR